jgi:DeoR family fructose operon transcriptional repressor
MENQEEKQRIGEYTAGLVTPGDFIYVDSGSSILAMLDYLRVPGFRAVTNSTRCAYKIAVAGNEVILLSGHFNPILEATVGFLTIQDIEKYNFSKGFFGVNGIHGTVGYSTPDSDDAAIKRTAMLHCKERYILADPSKFNRISNISITALKDATIITTRVEEQFFASFTTIIQVDDLIFRGKTRPSAPAEVSGSPVAK